MVIPIAVITIAKAIAAVLTMHSTGGFSTRKIDRILADWHVMRSVANSTYTLHAHLPHNHRKALTYLSQGIRAPRKGLVTVDSSNLPSSPQQTVAG